MVAVQTQPRDVSARGTEFDAEEEHHRPDFIERLVVGIFGKKVFQWLLFHTRSYVLPGLKNLSFVTAEIVDTPFRVRRAHWLSSRRAHFPNS
jgi:hypothetical protein